jgi:hypothetical protein
MRKKVEKYGALDAVIGLMFVGQVPSRADDSLKEHREIFVGWRLEIRID